MHWVAKFEATTPLFVAGADQASAELRVATIKSEIAFWWRAIRFPALVGTQTPTDKDMSRALSNLHEEECALFGSASASGRGGQGAFLIRLQDAQDRKRAKFTEIAGSDNPGIKYLGYGLGAVPNQKIPARGCLVGSSFSLVLLFRPRVEPSILEPLAVAMRLARKGTHSGSGRQSKVGGTYKRWLVPVRRTVQSPFHQCAKALTERRAILGEGGPSNRPFAASA